MNPPSNGTKIDMTLRLWSAEVPFKPIVEQLGVPLEHLHVAGQPMFTEGRFAGRIARRHFASPVGAIAANDTEVADWCRFILSKISSVKSLVQFLATGQIEGTLWIALLRAKYEPSPMPNVPADIVDDARRLNLSLFLENYTQFDDEGIPAKLWLTEPKVGGSEARR